MKGMPPKLMSDDGKHYRDPPTGFCREKDIERFSGERFPDYSVQSVRLTAQPAAPSLLTCCVTGTNAIRAALETMFRCDAKRCTFTSERYQSVFDFKGIKHGSEVVDGGDLAFDREEIPLQPAGWQPEEDDAQLDELRLNVVEG